MGSLEYQLRKILRPKILSLGINLGYLGPGSQKGLDEMFQKPPFPFIPDPNMSPKLVAPFLLAENLNELAT